MRTSWLSTKPSWTGKTCAAGRTWEVNNQVLNRTNRIGGTIRIRMAAHMLASIVKNLVAQPWGIGKTLTSELVGETRWDENAGLQAGCDKLPVITRSRRNTKGDRL